MTFVRFSPSCAAMLAMILAATWAGRAYSSEQAAPAELIVEDNAGMFSPEAIAKAKKTVAASIGKGVRQVHLETFKALSQDEKKEFDAAGEDKAAFWKKWSQSRLVGDRGVVILVNRSPGHVDVLADRQMRERGFSNEKEKKVSKLLLDAFHKAKQAQDAGKPEAEQQAIRDEGLQTVAEYLKEELPTSTVVEKKGHTGGQVEKEEPKKEGSNIGSYICLGLCVLAGVGLIIGLIRVFTGGGGGGMGGGMGGGGGFFPSLLGGLFGGVAGMWIYDRFFGGNSSGWGSDAHHGGGGDFGGGTDVGDAPGSGDFSGDAGAGGDFDGGGGGDFGGGDFGGGGDLGGGGDF
jgi:uncharacterized protein